MYHEDREVEAIVERFENCDFRLEEFTHARHVAVATWYLMHHCAPEALAQMRRGLRRFIEHHGRQGYHETITRFWMELIAGFLAQMPSQTASVQRVNLVVERFATKDVLLEYYSRDLVMSEAAKRTWIAPDRKSLETPQYTQTS